MTDVPSPSCVPSPAGSEAPLPQPSPSFEECYRDLSGEMVRLAYLLTGSREVAQDLVQDSFVRLHRRWRSVREARPYLRRAVVNACRSHHRRTRVERRHRPAHDDLVVELPDVERADEVVVALDRLPHRQRAALVLRFYLDLPDRDAATVLGCRVGTVASLVHRGLAQLRKELEP